MSDHSEAPATATETRSTSEGLLLFLVRHGATATTGTLLPGRASGLHLAETGRDQAQQVAERLHERHLARPLTALLSSPLERAVETATPTAERTGLPLVAEELLLECDVGDWTGAPLADLSRRPEWRTVQSEPSTFTFPGGESFRQMQERMVTLVERLRRQHPSGTVVCFSHADPLRSLLAHALGGGLDSMQRLSVSPASVSAIHYPEVGDPVVLLMNSGSRSLSALSAH